jgi:hypothetical protein
MEANMQRLAIGVMAFGFALSVGTFEATAGCGAHNETVAQKRTVDQPREALQAQTVAQPLEAQGAQQALSTVPVATTSSTRDSGSGTAQQ